MKVLKVLAVLAALFLCSVLTILYAVDIMSPEQAYLIVKSADCAVPSQ